MPKPSKGTLVNWDFERDASRNNPNGCQHMGRIRENFKAELNNKKVLKNFLILSRFKG